MNMHGFGLSYGDEYVERDGSVEWPDLDHDPFIYIYGGGSLNVYGGGSIRTFTNDLIAVDGGYASANYDLEMESVTLFSPRRAVHISAGKASVTLCTVYGTMTMASQNDDICSLYMYGLNKSSVQVPRVTNDVCQEKPANDDLWWISDTFATIGHDLRILGHEA
ncbi:MAG: hypothetical protein IJ917_09670 [Firmicutes bacterium]|nr:hypothetical protein [Bacillota bacterium]